MDSTKVMKPAVSSISSSNPSVVKVTNGFTNGGGFVVTTTNHNSDVHNSNKMTNGENVQKNDDDISKTTIDTSGTTNGWTVDNLSLQTQKSETSLLNHQNNSDNQNNTKLIFYDMMAEIIRCQLERCDPEQMSKESLENSNIAANDDLQQHIKTKCVFPSLKDSQKRPYMLQPSIFPMVYPTVFFTAEDGVLSAVPQEMKPFLRWKMTSITANTMRSIVTRSGYKLIPVDRNPKNKSFNNWNAIWCKHLKVNEFQQIGYYQRVNHFPGSFNFGRKDRLWLNLKNKIEKHGANVFGNFHPPTFILPHDYSSLLTYWKSGESIVNSNGSSDGQNSQKLFICKPPASARGQGIDIVSNLDELHTLMAQATANHNNNGNIRKPKVSMVVQEYISNPCLLHNDAKFDLRVYVLITSISPLRLYVYDEGIVRFAANRYSKNQEDIKNQFIHLTNYSVNKNCVEYVPSTNIDSQDGHKWTLKTLWKYLSMSRQVDVDVIWKQIIDLITKTVISAESNIRTLLNQNLKNKRSCFELLGFDIMMDSNMKLWLLEVNITPSIRADSVLDFSVKNQLVQDILNTLGYQLSPRFRRHYNFGYLLSPEKNDIWTQMSQPNQSKHNTFERLYQQQGFDSCRDMIDDLGDDDVVCLMEAEDELARCGKFRRVFPAKNSREYLKYFDNCHYYNLLLIAWEERYGNSAEERDAGRNRLRTYMLEKDAVKDNVEKLKVQLNELNRMIISMRQQQQQPQSSSQAEIQN